MEAQELLKEYFGHERFRPSQEEAVRSLLGGRDLLAVMPTGSGKSVCYQLPALMLPGVTLVISPLISLMRDQVISLVQSGIPAAFLNSSLTPAQCQTVLRRGLEGRYKLIYVAPERLETESFRRFCQQITISLLAVDEAHCVSQWGQDFRPSYLNIPDFVASLLERPILSAFTATATERVRQDIVKLLGLRKPHRIVTSFNRPNLYFEVQEPKDKDEALLKLLMERRGESGIIYCQTRKTVENVCAYLTERGFPAVRYHAGLSAGERRENQEDFLFDRKAIMVATNAFGMGIDKSNVSFVIHYNMPASMESYYQEAGRAGRDSSAADCVLLFSQRDVRVNRFLLEQNDPAEALSEEQAERLRRSQLHRLSQMEHYCRSTGCLRQTMLGYFGETLARPCGNCSDCLAGYESCDITEDAQKLLSCIRRVELAGYQGERELVYDILRGRETEAVRLLKLSGLSTFGLMKNTSPKELEQLAGRLEERGMLRRDGEDVFALTAAATPLLRGKKRLTMRKKQPPRRLPPSAEVDKALFEELRSLRRQLAQRAGVPAFVVLSDAVLRELCRRRPVTQEEFRAVPGIGAVKAKRYWKDFTAFFRAWQKKEK